MKRLLLQDRRMAASTCLAGLDSSLIFSEGEGECTSEMPLGQFSIFGAIEEKAGPGFPRLPTDQEKSLVHVIVRRSASFGCMIHGPHILVQFVARLSTGCAQEMQKAQSVAFC